jgi:hypothetical protein
MKGVKCETTKNIFCSIVTVLVGLFILALGFFAYATTQNLATWGVGNQNSFQLGVQQGQKNAILAVIEKTADTEKCEAINLFAGEGEQKVEVNLINTVCVNDTPETSETSQTEATQ